MAYVNFVTRLHKSTKRDYTERICQHDKPSCVEIAVQYGKDYWDGERIHGYGGYSYDGRWLTVAEDMVEHYGLQPGDKVLDVGCGKGFLLYEFTQALADAEVRGIDVSAYAIEKAKEEIKPFVQVGNAVELPYEDDYFDLVVSLGTFHNLYNYELQRALMEVERVGKRNKYIMVESYRNEREKTNMLNWQLTQRSFFKTDEWEWFFDLCGYRGDFEYIFFE